MRGLLQADDLLTITLAIAANTYELLCTAGLPMVYTRIRTLEALPLSSYYLYLLLYCVIYVVPLPLIVGVFTWTMGQRKIQAHEGQLLKLLADDDAGDGGHHIVRPAMDGFHHGGCLCYVLCGAGHAVGVVASKEIG